MHSVVKTKMLARTMPRARNLGDFIVPGMVNLSIEKALVVLGELCYAMQESQVLAQRVLNRLLFLRQEVENKPVGTRIQSDVILRYGELVGKVIQFLRKYSSKTLVARVAANRRFLAGMQDVHARLDYFFSKVSLASRPEMTEWKTAWDIDVDLLHRLLAGFLSNRLVVNGELTERGLEEALTEIKFELMNPELSATQSELMQTAFNQFKYHHKMFLPLPVPTWFVARDEVQYKSEPFAVGSYGALHRGMLERTKTKLVVKCMYSDSKQTQAALHSEGQLWARLDHPNVLKMKGGCYVGSPMFFLCEDAGDNRSFPEFFAASPRNKDKLWYLFLDAVGGLKYLHDNEIVHNNLKGSNLIVGVDGRAKLCDFGFSYDKNDKSITTPKKQTTATRWKAPELLLATSEAEAFPTFESDIYALGMCIIEAVTGELPWGRSNADPAVIEKATKEGYVRPKEFVDDKQWALVASLVAIDPKSRPALPQVKQALKDVIRAIEGGSDEETKQCAKCSSSNPSKNKFCNECGNRFP